MLRWIDNPTDAPAANAASLAHEAWIKEHVKNEPMNDYNDHHPHKGLKMFSPREFRRRTATS